MMNMKKLSNIAWPVDEPTYRQDTALSYSTLAKYERGERFNALETLFDKDSSASLTFGSLVDTMLTGTEEELRENFIIIEDSGISDTLKDITLELLKLGGHQAFDNLSDDLLAETGKNLNYYANDKYRDYRVKKIRESCKTYYNTLLLAEGKQVISPEDMEDARACVHELLNGNTSKYFAKDPFGSVEGFYQLKFKGEDPETGVKYRCMADRIIVNHAEKWVMPIDLKTSYHNEWEFFRSFTQWRYDIQARLYSRLIRQNMDKDEYFKDFKLLDYRFIVVNRKNVKPLCWIYPLTSSLGETVLTTQSGFVYRMRDPYVIGKELQDYLDNKPNYPYEILPDGENNIVQFITHN